MFASALLKVYDDQLRTRAETIGAQVVWRIGPLHCAVFPGRRGFVTYGRPDAKQAVSLLRLLPSVLAAFDNAGVKSIEWKTRSHDETPGLVDALTEAGFSAQEPETVMIGSAEALAEAPDAEGVELAMLEGPAQIRDALETADRLFGNAPDADRAQQVLDDIAHARSAGIPDPQVWVARIGDRIVSCGRVEPVLGTECAGLWGDVTDPEFRGRGIYRALTAARARAALRMGKKYLHSDSTPMSKRILERAGLVAVTGTTPFTRGATA